MRLVLVPDVLGRLWMIAEVCAGCAKAIPRAKVLQAQAAPPPRRTPANCPVCQEECSDTTLREDQPEGAKDLAPAATGEGRQAVDGEREVGPAPQGWSPPARYTSIVDSALEALAEARAGASAEARLLALVAMLRHRNDHTARFIAEDFTDDRAGLSEAALEDLIAGAWIHTSVAAVRAATVGLPAAVCPVPALALLWKQTGLGRHLRKPFSGWVNRLIADERLYAQPAGVRLAALYLTAHSTVDGRGHANRRTMAARCRFSSPSVTDAVLQTLQRTGWLQALHLNTGWNASPAYRLAQQVRHHIPGAAPLTARPTPTVIALTGRGSDLAAAAHTYHQHHRHPMPLRDLVAQFSHENPQALWSAETLRTAVQGLVAEGWLDIGQDSWSSVRPGSAYWETLQPPAPRPATSSSRSRHALSPRTDRPRPPRQPRVEPPPGLSPHGRGPQLPLHTAPRRPIVPADADDPARPRGIWTIPGAREILGTPPQPPRPAQCD
ncbi:hypothetical protein [Streptomyces sp. NPDC087300]|uniref:hypothetical protein n=1 Tax=Streptomyces sp. NPDC087300 TaxID=3365780 RepID=UPI0038210BCF